MKNGVGTRKGRSAGPTLLFRLTPGRLTENVSSYGKVLDEIMAYSRSDIGTGAGILL